MDLVTRASWGARTPKQKTTLSHPQGVAIHWEGSTIGSHPHSSCPSRIKGIQAYHMDHNGWSDIAYNFLVCEHGSIFEGRGLGLRSAANGTDDGNTAAWAVCAVVGVNDAQPDQLYQGLNEAITYCRNGGAGKSVWPHRHFFSTQCPGDAITEKISNGELNGTNTNSPPNPETVIKQVEGDLSMIQQLSFNVSLGPDGRGYTDVKVPIEKTIGAPCFNSSDPGPGGVGYPPSIILSKLKIGDVTRIVATGGTPKTVIGVFLTAI